MQNVQCPGECSLWTKLCILPRLVEAYPEWLQQSEEDEYLWLLTRNNVWIRLDIHHTTTGSTLITKDGCAHHYIEFGKILRTRYTPNFGQRRVYMANKTFELFRTLFPPLEPKYNCKSRNPKHCIPLCQLMAYLSLLRMGPEWIDACSVEHIEKIRQAAMSYIFE